MSQMSPEQLAHSIVAFATTKEMEKPTPEQKFREFRCDGCGDTDTFSNSQEANFYGWTWGEGFEFCLGCSY